MEKEQEIIRTSLRLPKRLYDQIAAIADERGLTMHAEIIGMLNDAVEKSNYIPQENSHPDDSHEQSETYLSEAIALLQLYKKILAAQEGTRPKDPNASNDD